MNTPITDAALKRTQGLFRASAAANGFADTARRLELDRAALMEALERITRVASAELTGRRDDVLEQAQSALAAARANFS